MKLDWLTTNIASTSPASSDPVLRTRFFPFKPKIMGAAVRAAVEKLEDWTPVSETATDPTRSFFAFERASKLLRFVDDVEVTVASHPHGATIDARSASRVGKGDFGQNRRNILEFFDALGVELMDVKPRIGQSGVLYFHYTPHPLEKVAELFFNPDMLPVVSQPPPEITIVSKPDVPQKGARMTISLDGLIEWELEFVEWDPPNTFTDRLIRGPFDEMEHRHSFTTAGRGCVIQDRVHYRNKLGIVGGLFSGPALMGARLAESFIKRNENVDRRLASHKA